ncbi:MAG TPA: TonB family protein [Vicinamibacterales bacterium]|nr:TonB family protein [Vicinamibacterales bacterium]
MIHFDFDDRHQDELVVGSAISKRGGVLLSTGFHALIVALILFGPEWTFLKTDPAELEARQQELLRQLRERDAENRRFVYIPPEVPEIEALRPPPRAELSDIDREARAPERAKDPSNLQPFSRGNTAEMTVSPPPEERARGAAVEAPPNPEPPKPEPPKPQEEERIAKVLPPANTGLRRSIETSRPVPGRLGDALRNLDEYVRNQTFHNPQGGLNDPGSAIQFDTRGIDFGPWIRRFTAQVYRNWIIPNAAMIDRGHVVLQFKVHRDGRITDLRVVQPSHNPAFNRAAFNAINSSNPLEPLPPEYPLNVIDPFIVTFYYNEPL